MCPHSVPCSHLKGYSRQFCLEAVFTSSSVAEHTPEPPCSQVRAEGLRSSQCVGGDGSDFLPYIHSRGCSGLPFPCLGDSRLISKTDEDHPAHMTHCVSEKTPTSFVLSHRDSRAYLFWKQSPADPNFSKSVNFKV